MIKSLQATLKQEKFKFKIPKSVQDAIPIRSVYSDGIFQFGSKYSKTIRFSDINYAIASKEDKTQMFLGYIASLSMRKLRDERGNIYWGIDEDIRDRLRSRLMRAVLSFEV